MIPAPRLAALLALLLASPLQAANKSVTTIDLPTLRIVTPGQALANQGLGLAAAPGLKTLGVAPKITVETGLKNAPALYVLPAAKIPQAQAFQAAAAPGGQKQTLTAQLGARVDGIAAANVKDQGGIAAQNGLDDLYFGGRKHRGGVSAQGSYQPARKADKDTVFIVNDEGVPINGRAAAYYKEVRRMVDLYKDRIDLSESLDVMDDTYADVWSKLATIEAVAKSLSIEKHNTHLEETLLWVDGSMTDKRGRKLAVHTHRVYFHPSKSPASEIAEGIRRVDRYIEDSLKNFAPAGKAEAVMGRLDEVVLAFDSRGYKEIKDHLKAKERELSRAHGKRYRFVYTDELGRIPSSKESMRSALTGLVRKYKGAGLQKIIEGVIYSRYVGILLELKTVEHFMNEGYEILQSGRDLFDDKNNYITELDTVVRKDGRLSVVEAKSARVKLPNEEALEDKVLYKLRTYRKNRERMEDVLGGPFDVVFAFDVGENQELASFLKSKEKELSDEFGFKVSFIYVQSGPEEQDDGSLQPHKKGKRRR
jgi:hypothetical protein